MKPSDFDHITHFTKEECLKTGANISKLKIDWFHHADMFRDLIDCPVKLICLNTGKHEVGSRHYSGDAGDVLLLKPRIIPEVLDAALQAGFRGIGVYWNGVAYSYHLDIGRTLVTLWQGRKKKGDQVWRYGPLIMDPCLIG